MLVKKALYRLKSSDAYFREHPTETIDAMGYNPSYIHSYEWIQPSVKQHTFEYYELIFP